MAAIAIKQEEPATPRVTETTLLDLVRAMAEAGGSEQQIVHGILELLEEGAVKLCGNFRGLPIDVFRNGLLPQN